MWFDNDKPYKNEDSGTLIYLIVLGCCAVLVAIVSKVPL
jgi:hypothetical protein